jgi:hypothetical protein
VEFNEGVLQPGFKKTKKAAVAVVKKERVKVERDAEGDEELEDDEEEENEAEDGEDGNDDEQPRAKKQKTSAKQDSSPLQHFKNAVKELVLRDIDANANRKALQAYLNEIGFDLSHAAQLDADDVREIATHLKKMPRKALTAAYLKYQSEA